MNLSDPAVPLEVRLKHASGLVKDQTPASIDQLLSGLDSRDETMREAVRSALQEKNVELELFRRAADAARSAEQRVAALAGLRLLKPKSGVALAPLLVDRDERVRAAVALALCVFGTADAEDALLHALAADGSKKVRYFVAVALGELNSRAAKDAVSARLVTETDLVVRDGLQASQRKHAMQ